MKSFSFSCFAAALVASLLGVSADAQPVVVRADVIGDAQLFSPSGGQDRNELILGNLPAQGPRHYLARFDTTAFAAQLADPTLTLTGATLTLTEQAARDGANGSISSTIQSFFLTQESGDWVVPGSLQAGVFGATFSNRLTDPFNLDANAIDDETLEGENGLGRRRFSGNGALNGLSNPNNGPAFGGHDQPDVVFSTDNEIVGFAPVGNNPSGSFDITFTPGVEDVATIDLLGGATTSPIGVFAVLNDWVNNVNAGIGLQASGNDQIFFQSADASVDSLIDGQPANTGGALDTYTGGADNSTVTSETGNGQGGLFIELTFDTVPWDFAGDFNLDGFVNAADYAVWRTNLGGSEDALNGNGTGDGVVDNDDFALWSFNFGGEELPALSGTTAAVPEPTAACLVAFTLLGLGAGRRARG